MRLRTYHESDEPAVVALWEAVFGYREPHNDPAGSIRRKLAAGRELFLVAEVDGVVAGTVMGGYDGHRGWIYSVAVAPEYQRRGIATALIRRLEADLAGLGCLKVNLQVRASNAGVVAFYETLGFRVEERVSMGKVLS